MIRHIVAWNFVPTDPEERTAAFQGLKERLEPLVGVVPGLRSLTVSLDVGRNDDSKDVVLISEHDDRAALAAYSTHPQHVAAIPFAAAVTKDRVRVDIEV